MKGLIRQGGYCKYQLLPRRGMVGLGCATATASYAKHRVQDFIRYKEGGWRL